MSFDFSLDPFNNFENEFQKAKARGIPEPSAMALATVDGQGFPQVREVLFKGLVRGGFGFFTNYNSPKARELDQAGRASLLFFWPTLAQQIRIFGVIDRMTRAESEAYFSSRPRESQLGAWASNQSEEISGMEFLNQKFHDLEKKFHGQEVPCPPHWGGYRCLPLMMEFWFGRQGRMHERYVYQRSQPHADWHRFMKSP